MAKVEKDPAAKPDRSKLRELIFNQKNFKTKQFDMFGQKVEVRQPTVGDISRQAQTFQNGVDAKDKNILFIIENCYVPGTNERVFGDGDYEVLSSLPAGTWLSDFQKAFMELSGWDQGQAEKN